MQHLTRVLKERHRRAGLYLEQDDHTITLLKGQTVLARFTQKAQLAYILIEADRALQVA